VLDPDTIIDTKAGSISASSFSESLINDDKMQVGEVWTATYTYTVQSGDFPSFTNTVTAHFHPDGFTNDITDSDSVTLQVTQPPKGEVLPTGVTCDQFVDLAIDKTVTKASLIGSLADGFNVSISGGLISNVADPGVAFYYTTFTAPVDADTSPFAVKIQETSTGGSNYVLPLTDVQVNQVIGTAPNSSCTTIANGVSFTTVSDGITFTLPDNLEGIPLVLRIRVSPKGIIGQPAPATDLTNNFKTFLGAALVDQDADGVVLNIPPFSTFSPVHVPLAPSSALFSAVTISNDILTRQADSVLA